VINPVLAEMAVYPFTRLEEERRRLLAAGVDVIDFGKGDPNEPTDPMIRRALVEALPERAPYPLAQGLPELREAAAGWLGRRFGVGIDPDAEIVPTYGSKEAIFSLAQVVGTSGHVVAFGEPAYPVYERGALFAGARVQTLPLRRENGFLPDLDELDDDVALVWVNYPHNPTGAVAPRDYLRRVGDAAKRYGFVVASDECYADIYFGAPPASMLETQVENVIAIHSCSKRSGMTGYRSGFLAGDPDLVATLRKLRSHPGVGSPEFVAPAAAAAWAEDDHAEERREIFRRKRDRFLRFFAEHGLQADASEATLYLWVRVPEGDTSGSYARKLLEEGIVVAPGPAFGAGEGYVRVALVPTLAECEEAVRAWARVR